MPPSEGGTHEGGARWGAAPTAPGAARSGPTRATPVLLLALAAALLAARVALGIVEHARPVERAPGHARAGHDLVAGGMHTRTVSTTER